MILGFQGNLGSGKTLGASLFAYYLYFISNKKLNLVANYELKGAKKIYTLKQLYFTRNSIIILDEIHTLIDSRLWKQNKKVLDFILQFRKYNNFLIFTTQHFKQVDIRLRNVTQFLFHCLKTQDYFYYYLIDTFNKEVIKILKIPKENISFLFNFYNTFEFISKLKRKEKLEELGEIIQ